MIRRNAGTDWLLISQGDHAHLAGEIAAEWGNDHVPALPVPPLLVPAVRDHDAGWAQWECAPRIDPQTRRPRDFTEMAMTESTAIWSRSIEFCAQGRELVAAAVGRLKEKRASEGQAVTEEDAVVLHTVFQLESQFTPEDVAQCLQLQERPITAAVIQRTLQSLERAGVIVCEPTPEGHGKYWLAERRAVGSPLGGIWVSQHFSQLAETARTRRRDRPEDIAAIDSFLTAQANLCSGWRAQAEAQFELHRVEALTEAGLRYLQFFDHMSLWLCCAERREPWDISVPVDGGPRLRFTPCPPGRIRVEPFPLSCQRLDLSVKTRRIAAREYADDADLQTALENAATQKIEWQIEV